MSGSIDKLRSALDATPFAQYIGLVIEQQDGAMLAKLPFSMHLVGNPAVPSLHGGVLGSLLQLTAASQLLLRLDTPRLPKMFGITIQYLRPGRLIDTHARATITSCGRRFASANVVAYQDDPEQPIASATVQFLLVD